jgi:hypothetical protein
VCSQERGAGAGEASQRRERMVGRKREKGRVRGGDERGGEGRGGSEVMYVRHVCVDRC